MKFSKKLNRCAASLIAAVMFIGNFTAMSVFAQSPTIKVTADAETIEPGDRITFTFTPDIGYTAGLGTSIDWDASQIADYVQSVTKNGAASWIINDVRSGGNYLFRAGSIGGTLVANQSIGSIMIETKDTIPAGEYTLPFKSSFMSDAANDLNEAVDKLEAEDIVFTVEGDNQGSDNGGDNTGGDIGGGDDEPIDEPVEPTDEPIVTPTDAPVEPTQKPDSEPISNKGISIDGRGIFAGSKFYLVVQNGSREYIDNAGAMCTTDGEIKIVLPTGEVPSETNRITAHVYDATDEIIVPNDNMSPIKGITATFQVAGSQTELSDVTDNYGRAVVPPIATDVTDKNGDSSVKKGDKAYDVHVGKDGDAIEDAKIEIDDDGGIIVELPSGRDIDFDDRTPITVKDSVTGESVADIDVTIKDQNGNEVSGKTDENGQILAPPENMDKTGADGKATVKDPTKDKDAADYEKTILVKDEDGSIEGAIVVIDSETDQVTITLPDGKVIDPANRLTIEITDSEGNPVPDVDVTIKDNAGNTINNITGENGKIVSPSPSKDVTDKNGKGSVTFTDKDGNEVTYTAEITDAEGPIPGAELEYKDGVVNVVLPDGKVLDADKPVTTKITNEDGEAVSGVNVTIKDETTSASGTTKATGDVTLPVKQTTTTRSSGGGGGGSSSSTGYNITIKDNNNKTVSVSKSVDKEGNLTLTLAKGVSLKDFDGYYTITVKDTRGNLKANVNVEIKDRDGVSLTGKTDKDGKLIIPTEHHEPYLFGYPDGEFKPEGYITRAETASIFTRLLMVQNGDKKVPSKKAQYDDVSSKHWATQNIAYLDSYDIIKDSDDDFRPDNHITRAEFVAMAVGYYKVNNKVKRLSGVNSFTDVKDTKYWAYDDIMTAADMGWISGYTGTGASTDRSLFKPDDFVTRAEAVSMINKIEGRYPHKAFINTNMSKINPYSDMKSSNAWYFYDIMEASYEHDFVMTKYSTGENIETWVN